MQGSFEFSSDLSADGCLWGATLRSPHPYARIVSIDVSAITPADMIAAGRVTPEGLDIDAVTGALLRCYTTEHAM